MTTKPVAELDAPSVSDYIENKKLVKSRIENNQRYLYSTLPGASTFELMKGHISNGDRYRTP